MEEARRLIGGLHDVRLALRHGAGQIVEVLVDEGRKDRRMAEILDLAGRHGVSVRRVSREVLDQHSGDLRHQGVLALRAADSAAPQDLGSFLDGLAADPLLLVLDGVQDPHNLGACLRSADGAGADAVIVPRDRACGMTPVVSRVAAGAAERVPLITVTNLERALAMMKERGIWVTGADGDAADSLYQCDLSGPMAIVLGAEGRGLRELTRKRCDYLAAIPLLGVVESLNVSVAAAVMLYEARRQRG